MCGWVSVPSHTWPHQDVPHGQLCAVVCSCCTSDSEQHVLLAVWVDIPLAQAHTHRYTHTHTGTHTHTLWSILITSRFPKPAAIRIGQSDASFYVRMNNAAIVVDNSHKHITIMYMIAWLSWSLNRQFLTDTCICSPHLRIDIITIFQQLEQRLLVAWHSYLKQTIRNKVLLTSNGCIKYMCRKMKEFKWEETR